MKTLCIAAVVMALMPAIAQADRRYDARYSYHDRGSRYDHHGSSRSGFSFSFGVSSGRSYGYDRSYARYSYGSYRPVYREPVVVYRESYCPPPRVYVEPTYYYSAPVVYTPPVVYSAPVVYTPAPSCYYSPRVTGGSYYYGASTRFYYGRR